VKYKDRNQKLFLEDMLLASAKILEYTVNYKDYDDFIADIKTIEAVQYNLIVIGEASKNIPDEIKEELKELIPFEEIAGLRNRLAHDYLGLDICIIWDIIEFDIPKLKKALEKIINKL
jgi:uncharacterized protein with HEPN domain